jgi:hypothetical protein
MSLILALDNQYELHRWVTLQDAMHHEATNEVIDHLGESIFVYHGGISRMTGLESRLETSSIIVLSGAPGSRKYRDPTLTNTSLFQRDRCICAYCGNKYKSSELTCDHIIPTSKGGKNTWMNTVASCKPCNSLKQDILPGEKLKGKVLGPQSTGFMNPLYVPYIPSKAENFILKNRNIKADQMKFLLDRVPNKNTSRIFEYAQEFLERI